MFYALNTKEVGMKFKDNTIIIANGKENKFKQFILPSNGVMIPHNAKKEREICQNKNKIVKYFWQLYKSQNKKKEED